MSSSADFEALARELRALRQDAGAGTDMQADEAMLVVRLVRGISANRWQEFCRHFPTSQWCALPVPGARPALRLADLRPDVQPPLEPDLHPDGLAHALTVELFTAQLEREILRITRNGGELALICASLRERRHLLTALGKGTLERLDKMLVETLRGGLEACDSLGCLAPARYALLLPGISLLRARMLAERLQTAFAAQARPFAPQGGISAGTAPGCALGIVCVNHSEAVRAGNLLARVEQALETALRQNEDHIHLASGNTLEERATLVHSSEKRFLFFGGE